MTAIFKDQNKIATRWREQISAVKKDREDLKKVGGGVRSSRRANPPYQGYGSAACEIAPARGFA